MNKFLTVLCCLSLPLFLSGCWNDLGRPSQQSQAVQQRPSSEPRSSELKLVTLDFPPMEYEENGSVKGIAVDLVREAFRRMDYQQVNIAVYPWARALNMVRTGEADAIFTAYRTPEREEYLDYSRQVLLQQDIALFARADNSIPYTGQLSDLQRYIIGVQENISLGNAFDQALLRGQLQVDGAQTTKATMEKLLDGRIDLAASNRYTALASLQKLNKLNAVTELTPPLESLPSYIAFSKQRAHAPLRDRFDAALASMKADGSYERIIRSYLYSGDSP
ncbi:substrate-binding periplasmic protein [Azotosporobacter soli]|uniref:substrate-binding periplasmic protein n=1 Tax=Azotosporobacter soli TaxID=3055040 RepID=UPI0031FE6538